MLADAAAPFASRAKAAEAAPLEAESEAVAPSMKFETALASAGATAVTFELPGSSTIESDNKDRTVTIAVLELPVRYSWAAAPKLSPFAYFRSEADNDSGYPLLAGPTHVYVDGSYVADASMAPVPAGGTFRTDLGVDESVTVERALTRRFDETTGALTKKSKTTWEYEIRVKNGKRREISLVVSDQLPVSLNEQITVKALAPRTRRIRTL
jgi:uncharacterized protein (TIGR02231 family)